MPNGKVKWFNNAKGYGFILAESGSEDLFAHYSSIQMDGYKTLKAGQAVTFDLLQSGKGTHAINIKVDESEMHEGHELQSEDQNSITQKELEDMAIEAG